MINDVISPEFDENGRAMRRIRSFVRRQGRLTKGQQHALDNYWPVMGVEYQAEPVDIAALFGARRADRAGDRFLAWAPRW
jgi:tRNA (guanine-N7-)-methyltransferase